MKSASIQNIEKSVNKTATIVQNNVSSPSSNQIKNKLKQICLQSSEKFDITKQSKSPNSKIISKQSATSNQKFTSLKNVTNTSMSPSQSKSKLFGIK